MEEDSVSGVLLQPGLMSVTAGADYRAAGTPEQHGLLLLMQSLAPLPTGRHLTVMRNWDS